MKKLFLGRSILIVIIGFIIMNFESAQGNRLLIMLTAFCFLLVSPLARRYNFLRFPLVIFDLCLMFLLFEFSKFTMNYLLLILPFFIIFEAVFRLRFEWSLLTLLTTLMFMTYHGLVLYQYGLNYQSIIELVFVILVYIFLWTSLFFIKAYTDQRDEVTRLNASLNHKNALLKETNSALQKSNDKLEQSNSAIIQLTKDKERLNMARDLHDSVGHEVTGLTMLLRLVKRNPERIDEAIGQSQKIHKMLRDIVAQTDQNSQVELRIKLVERFNQFEKQTGIHVIFSEEFDVDRCNESLGKMLYFVITEALTNVAKHTNVQTVRVHLLRLTDEIALKIVNEQSQISTFEPGNGLRFMQERVESVGGVFRIENTEGHFGIIMTFKGECIDD